MRDRGQTTQATSRYLKLLPLLSKFLKISNRLTDIWPNTQLNNINMQVSSDSRLTYRICIYNRLQNKTWWTLDTSMKWINWYLQTAKRHCPFISPWNKYFLQRERRSYEPHSSLSRILCLVLMHCFTLAFQVHCLIHLQSWGKHWMDP